MPTVNPTYWGEPLTYYETYNIRTGTSSLSDSDFTDFPPFVLNNLAPENTIKYTINAGIATGKIETDKPLADLSIAYCGIKNPDLMTTNIAALGTIPDAPANTYSPVWVAECFKTDPNDIKPVMFLSNKRIYEQKVLHNDYPVITRAYFMNPFHTNNQGTYVNGVYYLSPHYYDGPTWNYRNTCQDSAYYRSIGLRTVFGAIMVRYLDTRNSDDSPDTTQLVSLYNYRNHSESWFETHPILGAYLDLYIRKNTSGLYSSGTSTIKDSVSVDSLYGMKVNANIFPLYQGEMNVISQAFSLADDVVNSHLPLCGLYDARPSVSLGTNPNGGMTSGTLALFFGYNKGGTVCIGNGDTTTIQRKRWYEMYYDEQADKMLMQAAASYGLFFTDGISSDAGYADLFAEGHDTDRWYNEKMCLGVVDNDGYTDGTYTRGLLNATAPNWEWKDTTQSAYDPTKPPVPENTYDTHTVFNSIGDLASMTKRYVLQAGAVNLLGNQLWHITSDLIDNEGTIDWTDLNNKILDQFLTNNPIDCIISLQRYPMEIPKGEATTIRLGKYDTRLYAHVMEKTAYFYLFSGKPINPKFGDSFLDYNPYTKMELYVPFCGTIQLNPADIIGRQLNVQLVVDFTTGTCTGFIMSNDLVIETVNGNIAIDIPVTGIQSVTVASQLNNAIANKSNKTLEAQSASLGNVSLGGLFRLATDPVRAVKTAEIAENEETRAEYDLTHQNAPIHVIGAASSVGGWAIDLQCRLIIYYPSGDVIRTGQPPEWNDLQLARYGHTTGFACCIEGSIGSMGTGLVVGTAPDLNGMVTNVKSYPATAAELDMLRAAISEGVIL